jgi:transketolase
MEAAGPIVLKFSGGEALMVATTDTSEACTLRALADQLRLSVLEMHHRAGAGHLGSALSIIEILAVIFGRHFRWREPEEPEWRGDRFVLSKGHAAMGLYCALSRIGRIDPSLLKTFGRNGSPLEPHPNESAMPSLHGSTGSLGQGLSIGVGLALGARMLRTADRVFVVIGDGEANEGQIWEAARSAVALRLRNLIVVLDDNGMQQDGPTSAIMAMGDLVACWRSMGWQCMECAGHDCQALDDCISEMIRGSWDSPRLLRARTVKAKGVDFLEGRTDSHFPAPVSRDDLALLRYTQEAKRYE